MDLLSADKYSLCCAERANWSAMSAVKREDAKDRMWDWIYEKLYDVEWENTGKYLMLLCREKNDYTVFRTAVMAQELGDRATDTLNEIIEVLDSRGSWIAADFDDINNAWQLWVNRGGQANVYLLFDAQGFVIEC